MPIYRYVCKRCGGEFRELVTRGDGDWVRCSACGSSQVTRMLPRFGVVYKGSGFYTTDYRRKPQGEGGKNSSASKE